MILEELAGCFVSLGGSLMTPTPTITREYVQRDYGLLSEEDPERDGVHDDLIHREYEQESFDELPYYEEDLSVLSQTHDGHSRRSLSQSFLRSCKANIGLLLAVIFILGAPTFGVVYVDLITTNAACKEWMHRNHTVPTTIRNLQIFGLFTTLVPMYSWFPVCLLMLWGMREFKKNGLKSSCVCQLVAASIDVIYKVFVYDKIIADKTNYKLPGNAIFIISILCGAYLVARKFKKVNPEKSYSLFHIFFILSFPFLMSCLLAYLFVYFIIKYFIQTEGRIEKAMIAALTPGTFLPVTATVKYLALRKSSEMITPDRAFVLCYFPRGVSIALYRTMQSGFQNIWLFVGLSLLHGVSNVLSKATLNFRIKMWKLFIQCLNKTKCGPRLGVQPPFNSPRIRRLNADLEIQNILFEYATVVLSQAYLVLYFITNFQVPLWQVLKGSLIRIAISLAIDFVFNIISVFIQIHFYDIPMRRVWTKYWRRHVIANAFIIICVISYFGLSLGNVFADYKGIQEYGVKNCTSIF